MSSGGEQQKGEGYTRKEFVYSALALGSIALVICVDGGYFSRIFPGKWDFLKRPGNVVQKSLRKIRDSNDVMSELPIVGPLVPILDWRNNIGKDNVREADKAIDRIKKERSWSEVHSLVLSQLYGVPDLERYVELTIKYCRTSEEFLRNYKGLQNLAIPAVFWQEVVEGERYTFWQGTAFVGYSSYHVFNLKVSNSPTMDNPEEIILPKPGYTDTSNFFFPSGKPESWSFYISAGSPSNFVVSPLVYLISAATLSQFHEIRALDGLSEAYEVQNAFCNCLGIALAKELTSKLEVPRSEGLVNNYTRRARQRTKLFDKVQAYMSDKGVGETTKKFVAEPVRFRNKMRI
jgi:hypothetical protein